MINTKRLIELARKWRRMTSAKRRRISFPRSFVASRGHFAVYTTDKKRFMFSLEYLSRNVFMELLRMSEEEFGLPSQEAITLPCDSTVFEYMISLVQEHMPQELEKALLTTIEHVTNWHHLLLFKDRVINKHLYLATEKILIARTLYAYNCLPMM